ncbi:hypothetical protein MKK67_15130 [Methylobacterium sp. J-072]|nr:hypothetical protein [Methylobacterium sp. J-072]
MSGLAGRWQGEDDTGGVGTLPDPADGIARVVAGHRKGEGLRQAMPAGDRQLGAARRHVPQDAADGFAIGTPDRRRDQDRPPLAVAPGGCRADGEADRGAPQSLFDGVIAVACRF